MIVDYWIEIAKQRMLSKGMSPDEAFRIVDMEIIPRINNRTQLAIQNAMDEAMNTAISSLGGQAEEYIRALRVESDYDCHIIGIAEDARQLEY
jgi:hypothetical protein